MSDNKKTSGATGAKLMLLSGIGAIAALIIIAVGIYIWFFCRFYVPAGHMAVVTAKSGKTPAEGTILVERGEKGIWKEVLAEGRHFLDPLYYDYKIVPAVEIPLGKVGIVTSKVGRELPPGEIIAADHNSKGIWKDPLGPGIYRLNPEGYQVEIIDAINIPSGYVGVVTSQTGATPAPGEFAGPGEKGVYRDILQPGLYYVNPYAHQVNVIEIGMNQVTMAGGDKAVSVFSARNRFSNFNDALEELEANTLNAQSVQRQKLAEIDQSRVQAAKLSDGNVAMEALSADAQIFGVSRSVEFPSRDGFKVALEMTVEFELLPESIAKIYLLYGDLPQVVEKIIMPQVLSLSRLKGSSYRAQDFIMGEGRETFQRDLRLELEKALAAKNIIVHNAIIRSVDIPLDILSPIRAVSIAREQNLTNVSMQETARKLGELNTETQLIEQRRREVGQETEKLVAMIGAERNREVAEIRADAELQVANIQLKRSEVLARTAQLKGETKVKADFMINNERALGEAMMAEALGGGSALTTLRGIEALNPAVNTRIIHAGEGTLWTDLDKASLALPAAVEKNNQASGKVK